MIIAPLILPLRGLALRALERDVRLFRQSLISVTVGTGCAIALSWLVGRAFNLPASEFTPEILAGTQPNLADLGVAVAAGAISGFAKIRPKISDALAGTAIAVAYWAGSWGAFPKKPGGWDFWQGFSIWIPDSAFSCRKALRFVKVEFVEQPSL